MSYLQTIPSTTDDALLDNLSAAEILRYRRTCRKALNSVDSYIKREFNISKVLSRFFTEEQTVALRTLMSETGMFISGSVALQFFERVVYPHSDLDLYLPHSCARRVVTWLCSVGYTICTHERLTLKQQLDETYEDDCAWDEEYDGLSPKVEKGYLRAATVINLQKGTGVKIQLITSFRCPLEIIMGYHSTFVMNIITHEKAYCIYPRATLEERRGIWFLDKNTPAAPGTGQQALAKYINRGFHPVFEMSKAECSNEKCSLRRGPRFIGDSQCWVLPINPRLDLPESTIEMNSFSLSYSAYQPKPTFSYKHFRSPGLMPPILLSDEPAPNFSTENEDDDCYSGWGNKPEVQSEVQFLQETLIDGGIPYEMSTAEKKKFDEKLMNLLHKFRRGEKIEDSDIYSDIDMECGEEEEDDDDNDDDDDDDEEMDTDSHSTEDSSGDSVDDEK